MVRAFWGWIVRADTTRWRMTVPGHSVSDSQTVFQLLSKVLKWGEGVLSRENPDLRLLLKPKKIGPHGARISQGSGGLPASAPRHGPFGSSLSPAFPAVFLARPVFSISCLVFECGPEGQSAGCTPSCPLLTEAVGSPRGWQ